jgi:two-component system, NtrC family, nitrogen regulation response regulator GlnG
MAQVANSRAGREAGVSTYRLLLVEDDVAMRTILADALSEEGYDVDVTDNPYRAEQLIAEQHPDLLIFDMHLYAFGQRGALGQGWTLVQRVRQNPQTQALPIILYSADTTTLQRYQQLFAVYRCHTLAKPFDMDVLLGLLAQLLT